MDTREPPSDWAARYLGELATQRQLSPHTIAAYRRDLAELAALAGHSDWARLVHADIRRFAGKLHAGGQSARTIARKLSGWRGFYEWLSHQTTLAANPVDGVRAPKRAQSLPKALAVDDAVQLMEANQRGHLEPFELCNHAMFELLYSSGLRVSELAGLDVAWQDARGGQPGSLGWLDLQAGEVVVTGKGNKMRRVPVGGPAREALARWLAVRARHPHHAARRANPPETARAARRHAGARAPARAAPFVRVAPAAILGRPARGAGTAGPRQHHVHPNLYGTGLSALIQSV